MTDIIVLHGALGSAIQMQPVANALKELGSVIIPELPGHGATSLGTASFGMHTFVEALDVQEHSTESSRWAREGCCSTRRAAPH